MEEPGFMVIYGVALLAACTLLGTLVGEVLGHLIGIRADIGGVGFAMVMLIAARAWLQRHGWLSRLAALGIEFWAAMYIPIIVAMAAQQDVVAALSGGPIVILASLLGFALCLLATAALCRSSLGRKAHAARDALAAGADELAR